MPTTQMKLQILTWDEKPYREDGDRKFNRAEVTLGSVDGGPSGSFESLLFYRPDGTSSYLTVLELTGTVDGHSGSLVLQGTGSYDDTTATVELTVVEGSGTGEFEGASGTATSSSTREDYPHMPLRLTYELG